MYFPLIDIHVECTLYLNLDIKKLVGQFSQNADEEPADNENGMSSFIFNL
jgi:hypothetical protein